MSDFILFIELTKEMEDDKLVDKRKIHFRGDSTLECGSRLEDVPDYIDYDIKGFIDAVEGAVLKAYGGNKVALNKAKEEQEKEAVEKADTFAQKINGEYTLEEKQEKLDKIKANISKLDMAKLQKIMADHSITSFNDAEAVPSKALDEILELI